MDYYPLFWAPGVISTIDEPQGALTAGHQHWQFWPILAHFVDYYSLFWGPGVTCTINKPGVRLRVDHQRSQFWPILASFVDYYSLFWGPGVIFKIDEYRGAFTCRSSTLAVLADSGLFCGILLIVLGSRSDFQDLRTRGYFYVSFINTSSFCRF